MLKAVMIDDDVSNLSSLTEKLNKHCPQVEIIARCSNAAEGIHAIDSLRPDIVFLDIEMPVMNGFVMLRKKVSPGSICSKSFNVRVTRYFC